MNNADLPAMPFVEPVTECSVAAGLTKREFFAGLAMQGVLGNQSMLDNLNAAGVAWVAKRSVAMADALLAELESAK